MLRVYGPPEAAYRDVVLQDQLGRPVDHLHGLDAEREVAPRVGTGAAEEPDLRPGAQAPGHGQQRVVAAAVAPQPQGHAVEPHHVTGGAPDAHTCLTHTHTHTHTQD